MHVHMHVLKHTHLNGSTCRTRALTRERARPPMQVTIASRSLGVHSAAMLTEDGRRSLVSELILFALALKNHLRDEETIHSE